MMELLNCNKIITSDKDLSKMFDKVLNTPLVKLKSYMSNKNVLPFTSEKLRFRRCLLDSFAIYFTYFGYKTKNILSHIVKQEEKSQNREYFITVVKKMNAGKWNTSFIE